MSDPPNGRSGWIGAITDRLIGALPPAFLVLCAVNVAFLAIVLRFLDHETDQKTALMNRVLDSCVAEIRKQ
jgi:hypothetical protein